VLFLKAFAYFNGTENKKNIFTLLFNQINNHHIGTVEVKKKP
jgi:hypothetical protein